MSQQEKRMTREDMEKSIRILRKKVKKIQSELMNANLIIEAMREEAAGIGLKTEKIITRIESMGTALRLLMNKYNKDKSEK